MVRRTLANRLGQGLVGLVVVAVAAFGLDPVPSAAAVAEPAPGEVVTAAGNGARGFSGDGGPATAAMLAAPIGADFDVDGNLLIADSGNSRVRRVDATTGIIRTVAGTGAFAYGGDGGPAAAARLNNPFGVFAAGNGDVYVVDSFNHRVRRIDSATAIITTVAGNGQARFGGDGGLAAAASLNAPFAADVDALGHLYIADTGNHRIRRVDAVTRVITTVAGTGTAGFNGDGLAGTATQISTPTGVRVGPDGHVYFVDRENYRIRRIDGRTGSVETVAGTGQSGFSGDGGPASEARIGQSFSLDMDDDGNLFLGDRSNHRVRRIDGATGTIGTVAGNGSAGFTGDGGSAIAASFDQPYGPAVAPDGLLAITDAVPNQRIRVVAPPDRPPSAPGGAAAVAGDGAATVTWAPPARPVNVHRVTASPGGATALVPAPQTAVLVNGLSNGTAYTFTVEAFDGWGYGPAATTAPVTPTAPPVPVFDFFDPQATGAAPTNAYLLSLLSYYAYIETHGDGVDSEDDWQAAFSTLVESWGLRDVEFRVDEPTDTELAAARTDDALVVAFRGTEGIGSILDVLVDIDFRRETVETPAGEIDVHAGFWAALDTVYADLRAIADANPGVPIWLTGHSLGGALATLAGFRLAGDGYDVGGVHTFGAPNVAGHDLAAVYDATVGGRDRIQRWVNDRDVVPMLFDADPNYAEVGTANVFTRLDDGGFQTTLDGQDPLAPPGLDDHDFALYARRVHSLVAPEVVDDLPPPPDLAALTFDTGRLVEAMAAYGLPVELIGETLAALGVAAEAAVALLASLGVPVDEIARVLQAAYGLVAEAVATLVEELVGDCVELALVLVDAFPTLTAADLGPILLQSIACGSSADEVAAALAAAFGSVAAMTAEGLAALQAALAQWAAVVSTDPLGPVTALDPSEFLTGVTLPTVDPAATVDALIQALAAQGVTIDFADDTGFQARLTLAGGLPAPAPGPGLLAGVAAATDLTTTGDWDGEATLTLVFGVDDSGFYVAPDSSLALSLSGTVDVAGSAGALGTTAVIAGSLAADATVTVGPVDRLRAGGLATGLATVVSGTAGAALHVTHELAVLDWTGSWTLGSPTVLSATTLAGSMVVPGLDLPAAVAGSRRPDGTWQLSGGAGPARLGGLAVDAATVDLTAAPGELDGSVMVETRLLLSADDGIPVTLTLTYHDGAVSGGATAVLDGVTVGDEPLVRVDDTLLDVAVSKPAGGPAGVSFALTGGTLTLFPDDSAMGGLARAEGFTGHLAADGTLTVTAALVSAGIRGVAEVGMADAAITFGPSATGDLLAAGEVKGTIPVLGGVAVTVTGFALHRDGTVDVDSITVDAGILQGEVGLGGVIPFTIDTVTVDVAAADLDSLVFTVAGAVDVTRLDGLPFTPIVGIGGTVITPSTPPGGRNVTFTVGLESLSEGRLLPLDVGPVTLGFDDLAVGPVTFGGEITLGGLVDGAFSDEISAAFRVAAGLDDVAGDLEITVTGDAAVADGATTLDLSGGFLLSARLGELIDLEDLALAFDLTLALDADGLRVTTPTLSDLHVGRLAVAVGDHLTLAANDTTVDLTPGPGESIATFGGTPESPGLSVSVGDGADALSGWSGGAGNLAVQVRIDDTGRPIPTPVLLPGFFIDVDPPDDERFGLPEWLPLVVDRAGVTFPGLDPGDLPAGGVTLSTDLLDGLRLRLSGGLRANDTWPVGAEVDGLEVDLARLVGAEAGVPITNLDGIAFGVEPFAVGPVTVGGALGLAAVDVDIDPGPAERIEPVFYGRIAGEFAYGGLGLGLDLVLTEHGPVLAKVVAPMAVPLGQTGILLAGVHGGIKFGGEGFTPPTDPADLLLDPGYDLDFPITTGPDGTIAEAVGECARRNHGLTAEEILGDGCFTWHDGGTLFVGATLTSYVAPGLVSGDVTLAANLALGDDGVPRIRFAGHGILDLYGIPVGEAGFLLALDDPLGPTLDGAMLAPGGPGSPLGFVLPATGQFTLHLDTKGVAVGTALAARAFVERVATGSVGIGQGLFADALAGVASAIEADRAQPGRPHLTRLLTRHVLDVDGDGTVSAHERAVPVTAGWLVDRVLGRNGVPGLMPATPTTDPAALAALADVTRLVQDAVLAEVDLRLDAATVDLTAVPRTDSVYLATAANPLVNDTEARALAAYAREFQDVLGVALAEAGSEFNEVVDPVFALEGRLQPVIFGMPLGEGAESSYLRIDRHGVELGQSASLTKMLLMLNPSALGLWVAETNQRLGVSDVIGVRGTLPLTGVTDALLTGGPLAIDPLSLDWDVTFDLSVTARGFEVGQATGVLLPPRNRSYLDAHVWRVWDPTSVAGGGRIPVNTAAHYNAIRRHGGILVSGALRFPELVTDPLAVLGALGLTPPADALAWPGWIQANYAALTALTEVGSFQLYLPGFLEVLDPAYEDGIWRTDYTTDAERFGSLTSSRCAARSRRSGTTPTPRASGTCACSASTSRGARWRGMPTVCRSPQRSRYLRSRTRSRSATRRSPPSASTSRSAGRTPPPCARPSGCRTTSPASPAVRPGSGPTRPATTSEPPTRCW
jgi:hypothetical protein